jgi:predicted amidohydrolase
MIVDPWGIVVAQASDNECFVLATLDLEWLEKVRHDLPVLEHIHDVFSMYPAHVEPVLSST